MKYPTTPDGRYFVAKETLWRCTNPALLQEEKAQWIRMLMKARADVRMAKKCDNEEDLRDARTRVHAAKVALGERGPVWWTDGAPDYNRHKVWNTPYGVWYEKLTQEQNRNEL